ncbi:MAG: diphosphate--fructose-6-phosphate 1-phosphotransferase, partial [Oscillospiraceae bacterium]
MINIAVAQSGGPTCAINASLAGVFLRANQSGKIRKIYGARNGIQGVLNENFVELSKKLLADEDIKLLIQTPSTALGSCRIKLPDYKNDSSPYEKILEVFEKYNIGAFFYIGGNDSMDTVKKLSEYVAFKNKDIKIMGVPKTIDNDVMATDHTPGFGSAAKFIATSVQEIIRDSSVYHLDSVTIIEIMGRDAGWLTAASGVLRAVGEEAPHLIYLPERAFSVEKFLNDIKKCHNEQKSVVCAVSEGLKLENGDYVASGCLPTEVDAFGHKYLAGLARYLEGIVKHAL